LGAKDFLRLAREAQTDSPIARIIRFIVPALRLTVMGER
jgi:hypothetical protein